MSDLPNHRKHARLVAGHPIRVCVVDDVEASCSPSRMVDVSEGGMCFVGRRYLSPGTVVTIEVGASRLRAEIRHCRAREYSALTEFVIGAKILQVLEGSDTWNALTKADSTI